MIDTAVIEQWMRDANPIPTHDDVDSDELTHAVAEVHTRRAAAMQAPTQHPTQPSPPVPPRKHRRRKALVFAAAFVLVLIGVGIAALALRTADVPVSDEPVTDTTGAETPIEPSQLESLTWSRVPHSDALFGQADSTDIQGSLEIQSVAVGGPGVVAVGWIHDVETAHAMVWTSPDGYSWSRVPRDQAVFGTEAVYWEMQSVTAGGPGLVAVGSQSPGMGSLGGPAALVWLSPDGTSWTRVPQDGAFDHGNMRSVIAGGPGLVAVGSVSPGPRYVAAAVWTSPDGATWTRAEVLGDPAEGYGRPIDSHTSVMNDVAVAGPGLVAVGRFRETAAVWTSPDGTTWSRVPHQEATFGGDGFQSMSSVTAGGPGLVAVGGDHGRAAVWTSPDGYNWTRIPHDEAIFGVEVRPEDAPTDFLDYNDDEEPMRDIIATPAGLVAVGSDTNLPRAVVWVSADGINWTRLPYQESAFGRGDQEPDNEGESDGMTINSVAAPGSRLVAVGEDRTARIGAAWLAEP